MREEDKNHVGTDYDENQIQILEGLDPVRKRPGMYIGSTSAEGLHHMVWEIVDNSIDEHLAGHCQSIAITIHRDQSITVSDDGRGIPVGLHPQKKIPTLELVLTVLHAGGKFGGAESGYKVSGGLHGVGASVVNALSTALKARVKRDGQIYEMAFERGVKRLDCTVVGTCAPEDTGTTIWFQPDPLIFKETTEYDFKRLFERMRSNAYLNKGLRITLTDERDILPETGEPRTEALCFDRGIEQYVEYVNTNKKTFHDKIFYMKDSADHIDVEIALQYHDGDSTAGLYSFANNIKTPEGGAHETGFKMALTNAMKEYIQSHDLMKGKKELPNGEDVRTGLTAIISVKLPDPQFEGQTKSKLGNSEVTPVVNQLASFHLTKFFEENPDVAQVIIERIMQMCELRLRMKALKDAEKKNMATRSSTAPDPKKFADCASDDKELIELYLVEGDSAGGSAKKGRDRHFQAILPLRGKVLNTEKARLDKILGNQEISDMGVAIGTGMGADFDYDARRFKKVVLMSDADVDGAHIKILLLTFFFRYMRPLVEKGHIFVAMPPLFKIQSGNKITYAYSDKELDEHLQTTYAGKSPSIQRYKGLGEMNADQLWDTTMNPETRTLIQVTVEDAAEAEIAFTNLMGDKVAPRKEFIQENALFATLDI